MQQPNRWSIPVTLTGTYVRLEPLSLRHVDDLFATSQDPELWRWLSVSQPQTRDEMRAVVTTALQQQARGARLPWAQIDLATGRAIGSTSYYEIDMAHRNLLIGFTWLGRDYWRTPINTEAKLMLMDRAFDRLQAARVGWHTDIENVRSQKAIERLGAAREGILRKHRIRPDGSFRDTVVFSLLDDEWPATRARLNARLARR